MPKKNQGRRLTAGRIIAMCLTASLLLALIIFPLFGTAEAAAPSLPYIETLRARMRTGSTFRILEILGDRDYPTGIGSYIPGYETNRLELYRPFLDAMTTADRTAAANEWALRAAGDLYEMHGSDGITYPLDIAAYAEAKYWDSATTYPNVLTLPAAEHGTVTGTRTETANGAYKTDYKVTIDTAGNQILSGGHLTPALAPASGDTTTRYYYDINSVSFTRLTADTAYDSNLAGAAVYGRTAEGEYIFLAHYAPGVITPAHAQTYNDGGIYLVAGNGAPTSLSYSAGYYELVGAASIERSGGYLSRRVERLTLVETGGDCNFTPGAGETFEIHYNKLRYSGGFVNHNWFSRFVLDAEPADIPFIKYELSTYVIADVAGFDAGTYGGYDLIVVGDAVDKLPDSLITSISGTAEAAPVPALFFAAGAGVIASFPGAAAHDTAGNGNFVFGSMYFYRPGQAPSYAAPGFDGLMTLRFNHDFSSSLPASAKGLQPVLDDINYENDLRAITGAQQLSRHVSIATTLRYILNQHQPRVVHPLSHVRILEIQPLNVSTNTRTTSGAKLLFASEAAIDSNAPLNVLNWLRGLEITEANGSRRAVRASDVTITRMSTAEFNGKIEDLNESYELIYIGDSRANFNLNTGKTQTVFPNDTTMNGLLYYNIGEPIVKTDDGTNAVYKTAGLLNSDWINPTTINKVRNTATLRLPGNDISNAKRSELEDYINAGYPVVFAGDLVSQYDGDLENATYEAILSVAPAAMEKVYTLTATVSYFAAGGAFKSSIAELTSEASVRGEFEWHRVTESGVDTIVHSNTRAEPSDNYTVDTNAAPGSYYCVYRLVQGNPSGGTSPLGTSARSNTIAANKDAVYIEIDGLPSSTASGLVQYTGTDGLEIALPRLTATPASGGAPAYLAVEILPASHDALLDAYPNLRYIYTLEQYTDPGAESVTVGDNTFFGSSSADGANTAAAVTTSAATAMPSYTFSLTPQAGSLYRVRIELVTGEPSGGNITLLPAGRADGGRTYYDYHYVDFGVSGSVQVRQSNSDGGFALPKPVLQPTGSGTARSARLTVSVSGNPPGMTADRINLTAAVSAANTSGSQNFTDRYTYAYQWEKDGAAIPGATASGYSVTASAENAGSYRCVISATETASGRVSTVAGAAMPIIADSKTAGMIDSGGSPRPGTVNGYRPGSATVDRWTNLFQFMMDNLARNNVFSQSDISGTAEGKRPSLRSFLTLSKPDIIFTRNGSGGENVPTPYTNTGSAMSSNAGGRRLQYGFRISDPADPTPASTTYNVYLYVDGNASGKYTGDERVHIDVYAADGKLIAPAASGYALRADVEYRVESLLPSDVVGIIPWKLEIVKNSGWGADAQYFHGSQIGYTRIRPESGERRTLAVLQIMGWDQYNQNAADRGTTVILQTNDLYKRLTAGLEDFEIRLNTIRNDGTLYQTYRPESMGVERNNLWQGLNFNKGAKPDAEFEAAITKIYNELMYYDMLVIGFADCYEGVYDSLAYAILRYIESDKAVLFTHDTTSLNNMPESVYKNTVGSNVSGYWGYSFNQILRPAVGLDYYGIVSPAFRPALAAQNATAESKMGVETVNALKAAGYNIAYKPNSPTGVLEEKTHGYNTYYFKKHDAGYRTKNITQINAGQITTYPYNINLRGFPNAPSAAAEKLSVAETHFQYYALNMNYDDLVVWYALADDANVKNYSATIDANGNYYHTNDASNGYYIYTMGNVTYSGVGHHSGVTEQEAMLFVNTMIAAYRSSAVNVEVTSKDRNAADARYLYFPADRFVGNQESMISAADPHNEMFAAYYSFVDTSIKGGTAGISHARYYYSTGAEDVYGDPGRMIPISGVETYMGVGSSSVRVPSVARSQLYHFYIPDSVVGLLAEHNVVRIYFEVTTTYDSGETGIGHDSVELRKIGLLPLQ